LLHSGTPILSTVPTQLYVNDSSYTPEEIDDRIRNAVMTVGLDKVRVWGETLHSDHPDNTGHYETVL